MKTNIGPRNNRVNDDHYQNESLSVKDAVIWFMITVVALCIAGVS